MPPPNSGDSNRETPLFLASQCLDGILPQAPRSGINSDRPIAPRSRAKPPKNPPRPPNSFMIFLADLREAHGSSKVTTSWAGGAWRKLSLEEKQYYHSRSVVARRQHALQYPAYTLQPKKGSDRRPYGSRKTSAQRGSKSVDAVGTSFAHAEGVIEVVAADSSSRSGLDQDPQLHIQYSMGYPSCDNFGISSSSSSPQALGALLGLYGVPDPTNPQLSFPSPPTPIDLPLVPIRVSGLRTPPSHSPYSTSILFPMQTPPTFYSTSFAPCTTSMESRPQYPSPLLCFGQLSLDDQVANQTNQTSTSNLPPTPILRPVLLPEVRTPDYDLFSFPDLPDHNQEEFIT